MNKNLMEENKSHKQILKSTGIVGGAQILAIVISVVRTKIIALLLGPAGIGIAGIFQSTVDLMRNATGFGINFSGVRDIAEANQSGDQERIARTITILRRWALGSGLLGTIITIALCVPLSKYAFGNENYALSIAIISITLLITSVSASQLALLQGLRMITQMAKATLLGALVGTLLTLPLYWWLGVNGIAPAIIGVALISLFFSWLSAHKIKITKPKLTLKDTFRGGVNMAKLGFFIIINSFIGFAAMYIVRALVAHKMGLDAVGYFQAAWVITNSYIGIVLSAMVADFFPRLSAINTDNKASNKLINEQLEMALLVGGSLLVVMLGAAAFVIYVLYSSSFALALPVLQWQIMGSIITLISWPLGIMFLAKSKGKYCIITDIVWCLSYILFVYLGWDYLGFNILGIAYFAAALIKMLLAWYYVRILAKFRFSKSSLMYIAVYGTTGVALMVNVSFSVGYVQYIISAGLILISLIFAYRKLCSTVDIVGLVRSKLLGR